MFGGGHRTHYKGEKPPYKVKRTQGVNSLKDSTITVEELKERITGLVQRVSKKSDRWENALNTLLKTLKDKNVLDVTKIVIIEELGNSEIVEAVDTLITFIESPQGETTQEAINVKRIAIKALGKIGSKAEENVKKEILSFLVKVIKEDQSTNKLLTRYAIDGLKEIGKESEENVKNEIISILDKYIDNYLKSNIVKADVEFKLLEEIIDTAGEIANAEAINLVLKIIDENYNNNQNIAEHGIKTLGKIMKKTKNMEIKKKLESLEKKLEAVSGLGNYDELRKIIYETIQKSTIH